MAYTGGDIVEITYNHSTLGSGTFFCKAGEDATVDVGGYRSADSDDGVTADGQMIDTINAKRWSVECPPIAWDMTDVDEIQKIAALAASPILGDWTIACISGAIWSGKGKPVGDIKGATNGSTVSLKLAGSGKLKNIA